MSELLIKNGTIVNSQGIIKADIFIKNGKIDTIQKEIDTKNKNTVSIDASNKLIIPGGIDPHVHFALNTRSGCTIDDFRTGSITALRGGTTTFIDFITPNKHEDIVVASQKRKKEASQSVIDYTLHASVTQWHENTYNELERCVKEEGIRSVKIYMAYTDSIGLKEEDIKKVLKAAADLDMLVLVHAEEDHIINTLQEKYISENKLSAKYHALSRPYEAELKAVEKIINLAKDYKTKLYIVHVSHPETAKLIYKAKQNALQIEAETCMQYLLLNDVYYEKEHANDYILSPPLRNIGDLKLQWDLLLNNHFCTIATDHCAFNHAQKNADNLKSFKDIPNGLAGVEYRMGLLFHYAVTERKMPLTEFVKLTSTNAAQIFGLYPQKGCIAEGADADIVIFDPLKKHIISSSAFPEMYDFSVYKGFGTMHPDTVITNGKMAFSNNELNVKNLKGTFLKQL